MLYIREIESFLVIGGFSFGGEEGLGSGEELSVIAKFPDSAWSNVGQLKSARSVCFGLFSLVLICLLLIQSKLLRVEYLSFTRKLLRVEFFKI